MTFVEKADELGYLPKEPHYLEKSKNAKFASLEPPDLPQGKYFVIYADPPWKYDQWLPHQYGDAEGDG